MGTRGPAPKRDAQRRRRNKKPTETTKAAGGSAAQPKADAKWHPVAKRWYQSLADSGQAAFYEPSDWATAAFVAEVMSRELRPKIVQMTPAGVLIEAPQPVTGAALSGILKGMSALLTTEAERRRAGIELTKPPPPGEKGEGDVASLDDARRRKRSG